MRLTIITINYNDAQGLARTMKSVHDQTFKFFEHVVIDGNSTDGSQRIIEEYQDRLAYWTSEPDHGIYDAMNKGIANAIGEYLLFLNSGDVLFDDDVLGRVSPHLNLGHDILYGDLWIQPENGEGFRYSYPEKIDFIFLKRTSIGHPASFIRKKLFDNYDSYRTDLKIVSDWAFFLKTMLNPEVSYQHIDLIVTRFYQGGISSSPLYHQLHITERNQVLKENFELFDTHFENVLALYRQDQKLIKGLDDDIYIIQSNKYLLFILNQVVKFLARILKTKRNLFNKR